MKANTIKHKEFKVLSFDYSSTHVTNGMVNKEYAKIAVGKCVNGNVELQDGTILNLASHRAYVQEENIYLGYVYELYPSFHQIVSSEYNGKKVVKIEQDYSYSMDGKFEFKGSQLISIQRLHICVEGVKRKYTVEYRPMDYAVTVFSKKDLLQLDKPYSFSPLDIKTVGTYRESIRFETYGGGYGEKYEVSYARVNCVEFIKEHIGSYLSAEFKYWLEYGDLESDSFVPKPSYLSFLENGDNWVVKVESVPYEGGYSITGYEFRKSALEDLNKSLAEHIAKFKGDKKADWKSIKINN